MRNAESYRAARRNQAREDKIRFPWNAGDCRIIEAPPIRANKRDRSDEAEARRRERSIVMDFTDGVAGLSRALVNRAITTIFPGKPKRGWAAKWRRAPFREFFVDDPAKLEQSRMRHAWYRKLTSRIAADASPEAAR